MQQQQIQQQMQQQQMLQQQIPHQIPQQQQMQHQIMQPMSHQQMPMPPQQLSQLQPMPNGASPDVRVNRVDMTQSRNPREQRNSHEFAFTQTAFHPSPSKNLYETVAPKRYQTEVVFPERAFQPIQRQMIHLRPQMGPSRTENRLNYARIQPFVGRQGEAIGSMPQPHLSMLRHTIIK